MRRRRWWNPAGLATGAYFNAVLERTTVRNPKPRPDQPGVAESNTGFAVAIPGARLELLPPANQ